MGGWLWPDSDYALAGVHRARRSGRRGGVRDRARLRQSWSPRWRIVPAMIALAAAVQFLHYALFQEDLLSLHYYLVTFVLLLAVGAGSATPRCVRGRWRRNIPGPSREIGLTLARALNGGRLFVRARKDLAAARGF